MLSAIGKINDLLPKNCEKLREFKSDSARCASNENEWF